MRQASDKLCERVIDMPLSDTNGSVIIRRAVKKNAMRMKGSPDVRKTVERVDDEGVVLRHSYWGWGPGSVHSDYSTGCEPTRIGTFDVRDIPPKFHGSCTGN